jgi:DcuC family C4-dicarboxylate transporter
VPTAGVLPLGFAWLCGSGMATTQSLFKFFVDPSTAAGVDPTLIGAVVSIASAAGRTMSPVAAVTLMCATLTETNALVLARRVAVPLLIGLVCVVITATVFDLPH